MSFWNNIHQVRSTFLKAKQFKSLQGARIPKALNRIAKFGLSHLCLREENLSFNDNYIILELSISKYTLLWDIFVRMLIALYILAILPKVPCVVQSSNVTHLTKGCIWHEFNTSRLSKTTCDPTFSCRSFTYDTICDTRFSFKGVDLGYPKIFPSFNFF